MLKREWSLLKTSVVISVSILFLGGCTPPSNDSSLDPSVLSVRPEDTLSMGSLRDKNRQSYHDMTKSFSSDELARALKIVAQALIGRDPSGEELSQARTGLEGYEAVVKSYLELPAFRDIHINYYRFLFEMGGAEAGVNFDEPANLAAYLAVNDLSFTEIVRANYCVSNVNGVLTKGNCAAFNSDASLANEQGAGVLTTQAFLKKWSASFNFRRVAKAFKVFACQEYPDAGDVGLTEAEVAATVKTFNCTTCEPACYSCHRSMNPRAALFYVFDQTGKYNPGINNSSLGQNQSKSIATLSDSNQISYSSDVVVPGVKSRYHGRTVNSVKEYGALLAQDKRFRDCFAQRMTNLLLGRGPYDALLPEFQNVRDDIQANGFKTKKTLLQVATHPAFIRRSGAP